MLKAILPEKVRKHLLEKEDVKLNVQTPGYFQRLSSLLNETDTEWILCHII